MHEVNGHSALIPLITYWPQDSSICSISSCFLYPYFICVCICCSYLIIMAVILKFLSYVLTRNALILYRLAVGMTSKRKMDCLTFDVKRLSYKMLENIKLILNYPLKFL